MASSRSRTYLPKICGYILRVSRARAYRSKASVVVAAFVGGAIAAAGGCKPDKVERSIVLYGIDGSAPDGSDPAVISPFGDFPAEAGPPQALASVAELGAPVAIRPDTRFVVVTAEATAGTFLDAGTPTTWEGVANVPTSGNVDVLLWPQAVPSPLTCPDDNVCPAVVAPPFGMIDSTHAVLLTDQTGQTKQLVLTADLSTG